MRRKGHILNQAHWLIKGVKRYKLQDSDSETKLRVVFLVACLLKSACHLVKESPNERRGLEDFLSSDLHDSSCRIWTNVLIPCH